MRDTANDNPKRTAERIAHRDASAQAIAEREARWSVLTLDNAAEAIRWQQARFAELVARIDKDAIPCEECDCADPTALVGLSTDCSCHCHRKAGAR
jgi:hypothetical protein